MRHGLAVVQLREAFLDFGEKDELLDGIIEGGIGDYWTIAGARIDIPAVKPVGEKLFHYREGAPALQFAANDPVAAANHCRRGEDRDGPLLLLACRGLPRPA